MSVAGAIGFSTLKYNLLPDITFPVVVVTAQAPTATPLETEQKLTRPLEAKLQNLAGVSKVRSSTYPGQTAVSLAFDVGTNLEAASDLVKRTVTALNLTPNVRVIALNLNESAVVSYALYGSGQDLASVSQVAQTQIVPAISKLPGVLKVTLLGATNPPTAVRLNDRDVLAVQVVKRGTANTLEVVDRVEREVARLRGKLPTCGSNWLPLKRRIFEKRRRRRSKH